MKKVYSNVLVSAFLIAFLQTISYFFGLNKGLALLVGLLFSVLYLVYEEVVTGKEALIGSSAFLISTLVMSLVGKLTVGDELCQLSKSVDSGFLPGVQDQTCVGFLNWWFNFFISNPIYNWYVWLSFILLGIGSVILHRRYYK